MYDLTGVLLDGRYEIRAILARGGMATVYTALDTRLDRLVAVKVMHQHLANDDDFVDRFIREAKSAASLTHPNIVAVHDQGWNQGGPPAVFLVMEFVEGRTLREIIRDDGPLEVTAALEITEAVLSALGAAHRAGIVHRDVKPENVIIAADGQVKVADFGLARALSSASTITADAGSLLGTVAYLSPEQVERGIADARSDVYAVGIMLFEMLVGTQPFVGETAIQVAFKHVHDEVPAPSSLRSNIPSSIDGLVALATAGDPDLRARDANEFLREVQNAHLGLGQSVPNQEKREQPQVMAKNVDREPPRKSVRKAAPKRKARTRRTIFFVAALVLGIFAWYMAIGPGAGVSVPSVVGMTTTDATAALQKVGLVAKAGSGTFSDLVPQNQVISSQPAGGGRIASGGTVFLNVSKGPDLVQVPDVTSRSIGEATALLNPETLKLNTQIQVFSDTIPAGYIISTSPSAGTQVQRNTFVNATVSKGPAPISLINYVGKSSDQALTELTAAGLKPTTKMAFSDTVAAGLVISQTPVGGTNVSKGAVVSLSVSQGPQMVKVPNVIGMTAANAGKAIENAGLTFKVNLLSNHGTGRVVGQIPAAGVRATVGSLVNLDVY